MSEQLGVGTQRLARVAWCCLGTRQTRAYLNDIDRERVFAEQREKVGAVCPSTRDGAAETSNKHGAGVAAAR